ncbi:MAG: glycosyltransferase family 2 protein [Solirubrobacteraceae bacterium]
MKARSAPVVGAVVLTYNGAADTLACLRSLQETPCARLRIYVVDNGSSDDTVKLVRDEFPQVELVRTGRNLGYAGGNNLGIERAIGGRCDYVLVLNNDTVVEPDAVDVMVRAAEARDDVAAVAPLITYFDEPGLIWCAGGSYDARRGYPGRMNGYRASVSGTLLSAGPTGRFSGAAVLLRSSTVRNIGAFSQQLGFLYEDVDLSLRIRSSGLRIWFAPSAVVRHKVARTQRGEHSPASFYYGVRNQLEVAKAHAPLDGLRDRKRTIMIVAVHLARIRRAHHRVAALRAVLRGVRDQRLGKLGYLPQPESAL